MLSDNSTACCSERLKHNLYFRYFFFNKSVETHTQFSIYIYNRKKKKDRQSVTSFKSNMKQLKSADLTDHYNCNKYWVPNH